MKKTTSWMVCAFVLMTAMMVRAELLTFTLNEVGDDLVATVSGSVNTGALTRDTQPHIWYPYLSSDRGWLFITPESYMTGWYLTFDSTSFGTLEGPLANSVSGDHVGVTLDYGEIWLPTDYVSGNALYGTAIWNNQSFETRDITPGTYTATYNGGADSVVLQVGAVPEPATFSLVGISAAALWLFRRRFMI
jgi:hypothetical protein